MLRSPAGLLTLARLFSLTAVFLLGALLGGCNTCWPRGEAPGPCVGDDDDAGDDDAGDDDAGDDDAGDDDVVADPCDTAPTSLTTASASVPLVCVDPGTFVMGSPSSQPGRSADEVQHSVIISRTLLAAAHEVSQGLYLDVTGFSPADCIYGCAPGLPVQNITWWDALSFANQLSTQQGLTPAYTLDEADSTWDEGADGWRLPTESEWEYLARAGGNFVYAGSNTLEDVAHCPGPNPTDYVAHLPGEGLSPNAWGLYDMSGNVAEWVWDLYGVYPVTATTDPSGATFGSFRTHRGGSFASSNAGCRIAARGDSFASSNNWNRGFRIVRTLAP
jgi:sulfatase modifying factor 1